jgi:hypothetical protein
VRRIFFDISGCKKSIFFYGGSTLDKLKSINVIKSYKVILGGRLPEFYLHLINYHISKFDDVAIFLRKKRRNEFYSDETF